MSELRVWSSVCLVPAGTVESGHRPTQNIGSSSHSFQLSDIYYCWAEEHVLSTGLEATITTMLLSTFYCSIQTLFHLLLQHVLASIIFNVHRLIILNWTITNASYAFSFTNKNIMLI